MASGGAALDAELARDMEALGWKVAVGYGLTETSPILTMTPPGGGHFHSVGKPLEGIEIRIADNKANGGPGEIQARGPGVFKGYWNLPAKTKETFTGDGWFKTGDLGRLEEGGRLVVEGRVSTLIVTGSGENIQPNSVEQALDSHEFLRETGVLEHEGKLAVLAVPDMTFVRHSGREPEDAARHGVREAAAGLPSHHRPSLVAVSMDPIERTRLGKIKRHRLKEHFDQALEGDRGKEADPVPRREMNASDRRLLEDEKSATAWDVLKKRYPKSRLGPDSELAADLGMDSLEWLDISMELEQRTGVNIDEAERESLQTVRDLLQVMSKSESRESARVDPVKSPREFLDQEHLRHLEPASGRRLAAYKTAHALFGPLLRLFFRMEIEGVEEILRAQREDESPLVLVPNHTSHLDPILVVAALPFELLRKTHFIAWRHAAFANPLLAMFSHMAQAVPIDPSRTPGTSLAAGSALLKEGRNLVWFPEGTRSRNGELLHFQPGLGRILKSRDALMAPVLIQGAHEAMPPGRWWIKPARIRVKFASPFPSRNLLPAEECRDSATCMMDELRRVHPGNKDKKDEK